MLRTHEYVIKQLSKRTMDLLSQPDEVRYFSINGCNFYTCWLNEKEIAFGSGEIELLITNNMSEQEITNLFAAYIDSRYSDRIEYDFWRKIRTMKQLKKENPWFNMWGKE